MHEGRGPPAGALVAGGRLERRQKGRKKEKEKDRRKDERQRTQGVRGTPRSRIKLPPRAPGPSREGRHHRDDAPAAASPREGERCGRPPRTPGLVLGGKIGGERGARQRHARRSANNARPERLNSPNEGTGAGSKHAGWNRQLLAEELTRAGMPRQSSAFASKYYLP